MKNVIGLKMQKNTKKTLDDLDAKGMFSSGPIPGALVINACIMAEVLEKGKKADTEQLA